MCTAPHYKVFWGGSDCLSQSNSANREINIETNSDKPNNFWDANEAGFSHAGKNLPDLSIHITS